MPYRQNGSIIRGLFALHFPVVYKWAEANLEFVMNVLQVIPHILPGPLTSEIPQVHVLHTLLTLLEAILPCMQTEDDKRDR